MPIPDSEMPQLFRAADLASLDGQRTYLWWTRARLAAVVAGALCGVTSWRVGEGHIDLLGLGAVVLFVVAILAEVRLWQQHPERVWYDGRAVAESTKTSAWKFAVCGEPFPMSMNVHDATNAFIDILTNFRRQFPDLELEAVAGNNVQDWMTSLRGENLADRRKAYVEGRLLDQQVWYEKKAKENTDKARRWRQLLLALEILGLIAALAETLTETGLYFTPSIAAGIAAIAAWLGAKQHDQLGKAYATTVSDLGAALDKVRAAVSEEDWAREMNDAEDAISREHTLWLASRSKA
jgi:hypothetical protein